MKIRLLILFVTATFFVYSCNESTGEITELKTGISIFAPDSSLHMMNAVLFYKGSPFTGEIKELWTNQRIKSIRRYLNGREEGLSETFYSNGSLESARWYVKGEKDSVHTGWWENGKMKYEYHFKNGVYNGLFTEWYTGGSMIQQVMYDSGKELHGKGWRDNGELYMNFIIKNGRRYGMNNSNLCYGLRNESVIKD